MKMKRVEGLRAEVERDRYEVGQGTRGSVVRVEIESYEDVPVMTAQNTLGRVPTC